MTEYKHCLLIYMEYTTFFLQLFGIAIGGCMALVLSFYIVWPKIEVYLWKINTTFERRDVAKDKLQLKFAAYERLLLFVNRISPQQIMLRNHNEVFTVEQYKQCMIADLEAEFQHNFTQQLYVSDLAWVVIRDLKNSTSLLLQNTSKILSPTANVDDYISIVLKHTNELDLNPYVAAQEILKKELYA